MQVDLRQKIPVMTECMNKRIEYLFIESLTGDGGGTGRRSHSLHED